MASDLGSRNRHLRLECGICGWAPPEDATMEAVQLHMQVDHDTDAVALNLAAACACGASMTVTNTRPAGPGQVKEYLSCPACGNTGHLLRNEVRDA